MSIWRCAVVLVFLLAASAGAMATAAPPPPHHVLLLFSETQSTQYYDRLYQGLRNEMERQLPHGVQFHPENLDLGKFNSPAYRAGLRSWLRTKYATTRFDAIVVAASPGVAFLAEDMLWPDLPVYYISANRAALAGLHLPPNFTGQTVRLDAKRSVALMRQLFPDLRRIAVVGNPPANDVYRPGVAGELAAEMKGLELIDLRTLPVAEMLERIAHLPDDTVIYHQLLTRDVSGRVLDHYTAIAIAAERANRPIFVDYTVFIGTGALGGIALDPDLQGKRAAPRVLQLLDGVAPAQLPVIGDDYPPAVDVRQLAHWQVDRALLPADTRLLYDQPSPLARYRWQIAGSLLLIGVLSFLVSALLVERRRRARAVAESRARLTELAHLNRGATALVYSGAIAHELNQPLAAILANTQAAKIMLRQTPPPWGEIGEILDDIESDDHRASELIRGMRGLMKKGESGHAVLALGEVAANALRFLQPEAKVRGVSLRLQQPPAPLWMLGERVQLQQVLINLIINSMDAMAAVPAGSRVVEVGLAEVAGEKVAMTVRDAGPGFPGKLDEVFHAFATTKEHGTGLGLAITAALVREHSGHIAVTNPEGGGACVSVTFPRAAAPAASTSA